MKLNIDEIQEIISLAKNCIPPAESNLRYGYTEEGNVNMQLLQEGLFALGLEKLKELRALMWTGREYCRISFLKSELKRSREFDDKLEDIIRYLSGKTPLSRYLEKSLALLKKTSATELL